MHKGIMRHFHDFFKNSFLQLLLGITNKPCTTCSWTRSSLLVTSQHGGAQFQQTSGNVWNQGLIGLDKWSIYNRNTNSRKSPMSNVDFFSAFRRGDLPFPKPKTIYSWDVITLPNLIPLAITIRTSLASKVLKNFARSSQLKLWFQPSAWGLLIHIWLALCKIYTRTRE